MMSEKNKEVEGKLMAYVCAFTFGFLFAVMTVLALVRWIK